LAAKHCHHGLFLKVKLLTSYVFGLNYKPFGSCAFGDRKHRLLESFLSGHTSLSDLFGRYWERLAADFGVAGRTDADRQRVYDLLPIKLKSFSARCGLPKMGRWFSWNQMVKEQGRPGAVQDRGTSAPGAVQDRGTSAHSLCLWWWW